MADSCQCMTKTTKNKINKIKMKKKEMVYNKCSLKKIKKVQFAGMYGPMWTRDE